MSEITNNSYLREGLGASGRETGNAVPSFSPAGPPLDGSTHERFYGSDICLIGWKVIFKGLPLLSELRDCSWQSVKSVNSWAHYCAAPLLLLLLLPGLLPSLVHWAPQSMEKASLLCTSKHAHSPWKRNRPQTTGADRMTGLLACCSSFFLFFFFKGLLLDYRKELREGGTVLHSDSWKTEDCRLVTELGSFCAGWTPT